MIMLSNTKAKTCWKTKNYMSNLGSTILMIYKTKQIK